MALESSSTGKSAMNTAEESIDTMEKLMDMLIAMLETKNKTAAQKAMAEWVNSGKETHIFTGRGDCLKEVSTRFREEGIPYMYINNDNGRDCIIIRGKDTEHASIINREILIKRGNYYQSIDSAEMETIFAKAYPNEMLITVKDLNKYEAEVLKNKCNWITKGFMVGVEKKNVDKREMYDISIHNAKLFNATSEFNTTDFCKAYLEMTFSLYGPNMETKVKQIDADDRINDILMKSRGTDKELYLCGAEDTTRYMKIDADGFKYYECSYNSDGKGEAILKAEVGAGDLNYDEQIQKYSSQFRDVVFVDDFDIVQKHLSTEDVILKSERPKRTPDQDIISSFESKMAAKLDYMIKEKIIRDAGGPDNVSKDINVFTKYQKEAGYILESIASNKMPEGYMEKDIFELKESFQTVNEAISNPNMKISPQNYNLSIEKMKNINVQEHAAVDRSQEMNRKRKEMEKRKEKAKDQMER